MPVDPLSVPDFDDLPPVKGMPQGCVWGIFDQDGRKDLVGTLNFLTPSIVKEAASEVRDGVSISLKSVTMAHPPLRQSSSSPSSPSSFAHLSIAGLSMP